jgi:hypothetical protein
MKINQKRKQKMSALETIALIFILIGAIKLIVVMFNPRAWYGGVASKLFSNTGRVYAFSIILGVIVLWYLLAELTITQIFAGMVFGMLLMLLSAAPFIRGLMEGINRNIGTGANILKRAWLGTLVWMVLMVWVLWEIFA